MHVRGRLAYGRLPSPGIFLAVLALVLAVPGTALAAGGPHVPVDHVSPRAQQPGEPTGYRLPFESGLEVPVHQGWNSAYSHNGRAAYAYDFGLHEGTPVLAAAAGVVTHLHDGETACGGADLLYRSNYVTINHPDGSATHYGHLEGVDVELGDVVSEGEQIGRSGKTGFSGCLPHLHFARQGQGGAVTQSMPVYFHGYADRPLVIGEFVMAPAPACSPADAEAPLGAFCGTYSPRVAGQPAYFSRLDRTIDFRWTKQGPGGYWLDEPTNGFAARWSGRFDFAAAGIYSIRALASERVRVTIDGVTVLDYWPDEPAARELATEWRLMPGIHDVSVQHEDDDGHGALMLDWTFVRVDDGAERWIRSGPLT